jgi:predicted acylesterase/phospholipase RssA
VIEALRERDYEIVGIAGSSMGALVGGVEAAGRLDELADWAKSLTQRTILRLLDPSITAAGVLRAEKILIEVPRTTCRSLEFHRAVDVIAAGRELAMRALDDFDIDADFSDP